MLVVAAAAVIVAQEISACARLPAVCGRGWLSLIHPRAPALSRTFAGAQSVKSGLICAADPSFFGFSFSAGTRGARLLMRSLINPRRCRASLIAESWKPAARCLLQPPTNRPACLPVHAPHAIPRPATMLLQQRKRNLKTQTFYPSCCSCAPGASVAGDGGWNSCCGLCIRGCVLRMTMRPELCSCSLIKSDVGGDVVRVQKLLLLQVRRFWNRSASSSCSSLGPARDSARNAAACNKNLKAGHGLIVFRVAEFFYDYLCFGGVPPEAADKAWGDRLCGGCQCAARHWLVEDHSTSRML